MIPKCEDNWTSKWTWKSIQRSERQRNSKSIDERQMRWLIIDDCQRKSMKTCGDLWKLMEINGTMWMTCEYPSIAVKGENLKVWGFEHVERTQRRWRNGVDNKTKEVSALKRQTQKDEVKVKSCWDQTENQSMDRSEGVEGVDVLGKIAMKKNDMR